MCGGSAAPRHDLISPVMFVSVGRESALVQMSEKLSL